MDTSKYKSLFLQETYEHLSGIEKELLTLEKAPGDASTVDKLFRHYHSIKGMCASMGYTPMQKLTHAQEDILDGMRQTKYAVAQPGMVSALLECLDVLKDMTQRIEEDRALETDVESLIKKLKQSAGVGGGGGGLEKPGPAKPLEPVTPTAEGGPGGPGGAALKLSSMMKVDGSVFDELLTLTGELLTVLSGLRAFAASSRSIEFSEEVHTLGKTIEALHTNILTSRMLPFGDLTLGLPRVVRDISRKGNKVVELKIEGGEISLDRSILEKMGDPLVHIIRNAVDHGIEIPAERKKAGKPAVGTIAVKAYGRKENAVIEVADDGGGIDCEKLRRKAAASGMPEESVRAMTDGEALMLVCRPGLSLASSVTEVSGRGVGMDVVKDVVEGLGGTLAIESTPGAGTKFIMELPRTAAIMKVLLVSVAGERFFFPVSRVERVIEVKKEAAQEKSIQYGDKLIPLLSLGNALGLECASGECETPVVLVARAPNGHGDGGGEEGLAGFVVDNFVDELNAYIKPLAPPFAKLWGVAGLSILGDGRPVFLIDIGQVAEKIKGQAL